jgi:hypothetical protein
MTIVGREWAYYIKCATRMTIVGRERAYYIKGAAGMTDGGGRG